MTRREFLGLAAAAPFYRFIPLAVSGRVKPVKFAVITDLHHGLAPDALSRLDAFVKAVKQRKGLDFVMQMGDFCYSLPESRECVNLFSTLHHPKIHVLGNHDMDRCDKDFAMKFIGMPSRYGRHDYGGYRFLVMDLNHFKKGRKLYSYANGNYFTDGASANWADPEQLDWLAKELRASDRPVILISHQPLGFAEPGEAMPAEQVAVMQVISAARAVNPRGAVALCMFGHNHVDRLEHYEGVPCLCVNSASYFWYEGMRAYTKPLYAFMEITADGVLKIEGQSGEFVKAPPATSDKVIGRSASLSSRRLELL